MESVKGITSLETSIRYIPKSNSNPSVEVIVIEDNHLTNMVMSKALASTIKKIQNLKNIYIRFSCFHSGREFLDYFENTEFRNSKLIVFSDYFLEDNMNGGEILRKIKQRKADATVVIVSDTANTQIRVDVMNMGAYGFIPKSSKAHVFCSEVLFQKVV